MKHVWALIVCLISLSFSAVHAADLEMVKKTGKLRIAVDSTYPPMEFEGDDGKVAGLDIDLAKELAGHLKVTTEFIVMPWDGILAGLQSDRYDIIMSSMNITPERAAQVNFAEYMKMGQVFVCKKEGKQVKTEKDLAGLVVAVQADTTSANAVEGFKKAGVAVKDIKQFKGATETFAAVKSGQADVIVTDEPVGRYYAGLDAKTFSVSGEAIKPEPIGIAVRKEDVKLLTALNDALTTIKKNGTYKKVYKHWLKADPKH